MRPTTESRRGRDLSSRRKKLTNNSDETDVASLLSGDNIFAIPYFQRPYKWRPERLKGLQSDLLKVVDGETDSHFLGAVIIHGQRSNPSDPTTFEVIDGQQRITTLFLLLCASIRCLTNVSTSEADYRSEALALYQKYIALGRSTSALSNVKLHSCKEDRNQLNAVMSDMISDVKFSGMLGSFQPIALPSTGGKSGQLLKNYRSALKFFDDQFEQGGVERIRDIYSVLLENVSVVQIDVWDPTDGPRIFNSLNSKQEPMTIGDLVRNEIFGKVSAQNAIDIERVDQNLWQPFYKEFQVGDKNHFDSYFFPYALIRNPNIAKSGAFNFLKEQWKDTKSPETIVSQLKEYQLPFVDLMTGGNRTGWPKKVHAALRRLHAAGLPSSTLPYVMQLGAAVTNGTATDGRALELATALEAFLVRRALCGIEPTGLHSIFRRLWSDLNPDPSGAKFKSEILGRKTITWPTDEQVREAVMTRPLYGSAILPFVVREYDVHLGGDVPEDAPWMEHILPQKMNNDWQAVFTADLHEKLVDTWGNLIPLSAKMDMSVQNKSYQHKREVFKKDAMFKSAREVSTEFEDWTQDSIVARGKILADWAVTRWPE